MMETHDEFRGWQIDFPMCICNKFFIVEKGQVILNTEKRNWDVGGVGHEVLYRLWSKIKGWCFLYIVLVQRLWFRRNGLQKNKYG